MLMTKTRFGGLALAILAGTIACAAPAAADVVQSSRTWVSGGGDDANACTRTAPCKTFDGALAKTKAGGEIDCLDNAGYGGVGIQKSVTIDCEATGGGIIVDNNGGISIIDAGTDNPGTIQVVLRGIHFEGGGGVYGPGLEAIVFDSGASLTIEKCIIRDFTGDAGIYFAPRTSAKLSVTDTSIINSGSASGAGIVIKTTGFGQPVISAVIDHVQILNSPNIGLQVTSAGTPPTGMRTIVFVKDSVIYGGAYGAAAIVPPNKRAIQLSISDSSITSNTGYGVAINGTGAQGRIRNTAITGNAVGITAQNGGAVVSQGGNSVYANQTDGTFTTTFAQQ